jgi:hypothetical protein
MDNVIKEDPNKKTARMGKLPESESVFLGLRKGRKTNPYSPNPHADIETRPESMEPETPNFKDE